MFVQAVSILELRTHNDHKRTVMFETNPTGPAQGLKRRTSSKTKLFNWCLKFPVVFRSAVSEVLFFKVLFCFIALNCFYLCFNGFEWFKWLFEPIRLELDQVSAQMVDPPSESWHLVHGLLGWGTTLRELKVLSGIASKQYTFRASKRQRGV